jgi:cell division protein FtsB
MGLRRLREDSIKELKERKTTEQLQEENEALKKQVDTLDNQLTEAQLALCDLYELMVGGDE